MKIAFLNRVKRPFNANTVLNEPVGGTQSALIYMARELANSGHEVFVFCNCDGLEGNFDGVEYLSLKKIISFTKANTLDYFIPVADEMALNLRIPAKSTICWLHNDYYFLKDELPDIRDKIAMLLKTKADKLLTLSDWHTRIISDIFSIPKEHFFQTRNGIHWPYFDNNAAQKRLPRLFYSSVPDRGLDILLDMFSRLIEKKPELELHLYTSFKVWGKSKEWDQQMASSLYAKAKNQKGVFLHQPLTHHALAKKLQEGTLWLYPMHSAPETKFQAETSCIAAIEAQAAGLPVIATAEGALPETIVNDHTGLLIAGNPYDIDFQEKFIESTLNLLDDPEKLKQFRQEARQRVQEQYTWKAVAKQWNEELFRGFTSTRREHVQETSIFDAPKLSVVLTLTQNISQKELENSLQSLEQQSQNFKAFEVVVCQQNGHLNLKSDKLNLRYRSISLEEEYPHAFLRNKALELVRGEWVLFVNSIESISSLNLVNSETYFQQHPRKMIINDETGFIGGPLQLVLRNRGFETMISNKSEDLQQIINKYPYQIIKD